MHRFTILPDEAGDAAKVSDRLEQTLAIKRWTRETLRLPEDAVVTVNEFCCADQGCPLLESIIAVHDSAGARTWRFTRPRVAVSKTMVQQAIRAGGG